MEPRFSRQQPELHAIAVKEPQPIQMPAVQIIRYIVTPIGNQAVTSHPLRFRRALCYGFKISASTLLGFNKMASQAGDFSMPAFGNLPAAKPQGKHKRQTGPFMP